MRKSMLAVASHASTVTRASLSDGHAISALAALAQPTRLAIFRLLVKHEPVGITAGVIADTIGAPHNTLSSHLAILVRAGCCEVRAMVGPSSIARTWKVCGR